MPTDYKIVKIDTIPEEDPYRADTGGVSYTEIEIQPCGKVFVTQEYNNGSTSMDVWNGVVLTAKIPHVEENFLLEFLTDNDNVQKIIDGMDTVWNGSNIVGKHSDDAIELFDALVDEINSWGDFYCMWNVEDWFGQNTPDELGVAAKTTDKELKRIAKDLEQNPENGDFIDGMRAIVNKCDILEYITELRDILISELE